MYKKHGMFGLFLLLVVILIIKPRVFYNLYNHILGRVLLIGVILFFTVCNVTLGLFAALCLIIASNMFFIEGLDNLNSGTTIGDDNADNTSDTTIKVTTDEDTGTKDGSKISDLQAKVKAKAKAQADTTTPTEAFGIDRLSIQQAIQSISSKTIPVSIENFTSENVSPTEDRSSVVKGFLHKFASFN